jgi:hypothetical protein
MLRIIMFAVALAAATATASNVEASYCVQTYESASAHLRWALARPIGADASQKEETCRAYRSQFFDAAKARQIASQCRNDIDRQRALDTFDAALDAINDLIAERCTYN